MKVWTYFQEYDLETVQLNFRHGTEPAILFPVIVTPVTNTILSTDRYIQFNNDDWGCGLRYAQDPAKYVI